MSTTSTSAGSHFTESMSLGVSHRAASCSIRVRCDHRYLILLLLLLLSVSRFFSYTWRNNLYVLDIPSGVVYNIMLPLSFIHQSLFLLSLCKGNETKTNEKINLFEIFQSPVPLILWLRFLRSVGAQALRGVR